MKKKAKKKAAKTAAKKMKIRFHPDMAKQQEDIEKEIEKSKKKEG